ncbi:two component transcriptional regulator, winged helix family [Tistlia consotensis]|uniref:Two component transcriptional regulator, winged helix family n=1 Tax=Tistlia consotensis USBA 355 TaxID=560819 RepID=A0A1Y6CG49_9PROT|nr:response regulator transcription factor [Tistlia consotensis]SMF60088.1 two component transcriptional regulator, winged helix family [Tistlia consotensis USBA 355]SNR93894.1 two component transcriptional regulator, winged helix family [Tistlia consotensis]
MHRILLVDDDVNLAEMIREFLELEGFAVEAVHDGQACLSRDLGGIDLIVLDVMLPKLSGFEVLRRLRQSPNVPAANVPVIMLTARGDEVDRIVGLEIGADDYLPKPVNPRELVARIRAVLRRTEARAPAPGGELRIGEIRLNPASRAAWADERELELTSAEFNLLEHLLRNAGRIVAREELSAAAFGRDASIGAYDRNVDTLVSKVRRKLDPGSDLDRRIKTVRNVGYLFALPTPEPGAAVAAAASSAQQPS